MGPFALKLLHAAWIGSGDRTEGGPEHPAGSEAGGAEACGALKTRPVRCGGRGVVRCPCNWVRVSLAGKFVWEDRGDADSRGGGAERAPANGHSAAAPWTAAGKCRGRGPQRGSGWPRVLITAASDKLR